MAFHRRRLPALLAFLLVPPIALGAEGIVDVADLDLADLVALRVSPFEVSTRLDNGYRAANSVTGSRFDTPVRDLPFAIQAFTDSFIADQHPGNVFDIARYSPGVTYRSNDFNEGDANLAIRGFAVANSPGAVQILRDGFHGPSILDLTNVSRLEVVKGPASFLYGQVAPGGIVNVITKSPQSRFAGNVDVRYGSYDQYRVDADLTGPAGKKLFYRLAASAGQDIHYWQPYDANNFAVAPTLLWQPSEKLSVTLKYEYYRKDESPQLMQKPGYNAQAGVVPSPRDPNLSAVDVPGLADTWNTVANADYRRSESSQLSTWLDFAATPHWHLRAGYSHLGYDVDALFSGNLGMANNSTLLQGRRVRAQTYTNDDSTYELQALGHFRRGHTSLRLLFGTQYVSRRFDNWAAQAPNDPTLGSNPTASPLPLWDLGNPATWNRLLSIPRSALTANPTDQTTDYVDRSVYGGSTFGFFDDQLLLLAGWRRTTTESQLFDRVKGELQPGIDTSATTPQFGALYKITPGVSLFASYAESFVPIAATLRNPDGTRSLPRPTEGRGYDVGIKTDWPNARLSGTLTFFDIHNRNIVNDLAVTDASGSVTIYNVQSGEQRSRGFELDTTFAPTENWQLYLSYSRMHARITEFSGNDAAILAQDPTTLSGAARDNYRNVLRLHNAPLQMSAPHLANLWARYDFTDDSLRGLYIAGGINYVRDQTLLPDTPAWARQTYALVNLLAGYQWTMGRQRVSVELMGKNLTDEQYRPSQSTRSRPREFQLTLRTRF